MRHFTHLLAAITVSGLALACESAVGPSGGEGLPTVEPEELEFVNLDSAEEIGVTVDICHRTNGKSAFRLITVAEAAVDAHTAHGDGRVGDPVPGRPGMEFNQDCEPVLSRTTVTATGRWTGSTYFLSKFTVSSEGPVDAIATVSGFTGQMRLALLGYNPNAPVSTCSTAWLSIPVPIGPTMQTPTISAQWDEIPAGTYCLNVVTAAPVPPYPEPYSWTATITYP